MLVLLGGWKAETADLELPVPKGWRFNPSEYKPSPWIPLEGSECGNAIWFDVFPGTSEGFVKELIATESIDVTAAIRHWNTITYADVTFAKHRGSVFRKEERSVYLFASDHGVLVAQAMAQGERPDACLPLHDEVAAKLVELFFARRTQDRVKQLARTAKPPPLNVVKPIPKTLDEALEMLRGTTSPEVLDTIRASTNERDMVRLHLGTGMSLRNDWGLWGGSPLAKHFEAMGVFHPDDMSSIILRSFWRLLHGQPLGVETQAAVARRYWDLRRTPAELESCGDGGVVKVLGLAAPDRFVQIYTCGPGRFRAYELDAGWYAPDERMTKRVEQLRREGVISAPLNETVRGGTVTQLPAP